jgi:hypothetical protein
MARAARPTDPSRRRFLAVCLAGAAAGLSLAYILGASVATLAFVRLSGRPARELVPAPSDLAWYAGLARGVLSSVRAQVTPAG